MITLMLLDLYEISISGSTSDVKWGTPALWLARRSDQLAS
jgi:hypothetical protein